MQRWFVPVGPRAGQPIRQFWAEMKAGTTELQNKREMGWPRVLILVEESDGPMLYRYTAEGDYAGDTWHESLTDARDQAAFEYTSSLGTWQEIPDTVQSGAEVEYALTTVEARQPDRREE
jgi:hypothetical protein